MQVRANEDSIYPTPVLNILRTKDGLKMIIDYLELLKDNYKPVKEVKK